VGSDEAIPGGKGDSEMNLPGDGWSFARGLHFTTRCKLHQNMSPGVPLISVYSIFFGTRFILQHLLEHYFLPPHAKIAVFLARR
jgi:hypothetical protein